MGKIVRTPTRAEGGITPDEKRQMGELVKVWIQRAFRTDPIEPDKITEAIKGLYRVSGLKEPRVVIVPSPRVMALAGGISAGVWYLRKIATYNATDIATDIATRIATDIATYNATDIATYNATRIATDIATYNATYNATDNATENATDNATYNATRIATDNATDNATYNATRIATRIATDNDTAIATENATYNATRIATDIATDNATYNATDIATRIATDNATYNATRIATDNATDNATYNATRIATYIATDNDTAIATENATDNATYNATANATDNATRIATDNATYNATDIATRIATDNATYNATDIATYNATRIATRIATYNATDIATYNATAKFLISCIGRWSWMYQGGNMWAYWGCYLSAVRDVLKLKLPEFEKYYWWEQASIHGGFRIMHDEFCMVSDFPEILKVDDQNRPHCDDGPSHRWRDGWELYHWHGVAVTEQIIKHPETLTIEQVKAEENAEVRRVMIERMGWDRFCAAAEMKVIHRDKLHSNFPTIPVSELVDAGSRFITTYRSGIEKAELLQAKGLKDLEGRPLKFVRLTDPSTGRQYTIRVKHNHKRCYEAVGWTFRMTEEEYKTSKFLRQGDVFLKPLDQSYLDQQQHS